MNIVEKAAAEVLKDLATPPKQVEDTAFEGPSPAKASSEDTLPDPEHDVDIGLLYENVTPDLSPSGPYAPQ